MDIVVYIVWGLFTGFILSGNFGKNHQETKPEEDLVSKMIMSEPVEKERIVEADVLKEVFPIEKQSDEKVVAVEETTLQIPVDVATAEISPSNVEIALPKNLKLNQLMLDNSGMPMVHVLQKGETLTQIAYKYFEDTRFWPYIYEVNRHQLISPDKVKEDMQLYLPNPDFYDIDSNNLESINKSRKLISNILKQ